MLKRLSFYQCLATVGLALGLAIALAATPAAAEETGACAGFDKKHTVTALGGPNAFSKEGAKTWQDLARIFDRHRAEIEAILQEKGLGHVSQQLFDQIKTGQVSERELAAGEGFEWMALRRKKKPETTGPICLDLKKPGSAFVVEIVVPGEAPKIPEPTCSVTATGDCRSHQLAVTASSGATVTVDGKTVISGGGTSWEGPWENRFDHSPTVVARAESPGQTYVASTTYTFAVPKACANLSYGGMTSVEATVPAKTCSKTAPAITTCPKPECSITAPIKVKKRQPFEVSMTGNGLLDLEVKDPKGGTVSLANDAASPFSTEQTYKKKGDYLYSGMVTTEFGDTATCQAKTCVGRKCPEPPDCEGCPPKVAERCGAPDSNLTLRAFGARFDSGDEARTITQISPTLQERTKTQVGNGFGAGASLEYLFSKCVGLEGGLLYGQLDSMYTLDLNELWGMEGDDLGFLAFTLGPNFHLTPNSRVDLYLGPFLALASLDDGDYSVLGQRRSLEFDDETTWGAQLGLDIPFQDGGPLGAHLGVRYIDLSLEDEVSGADFDIDPLIFTAGLSFRF